MDQQKRFLLALVISGAILLVWQNFFAPKPDPKLTDKNKTALVKKDGDKTTDKNDKKTDVKTDTKTPVETTKPIAKKNVAVVNLKMKTDKFIVGLTNDGARVKSLNYLSPNQYSKAGDLLGDFPKTANKYKPFQVSFASGKLKLPDNLVWELDAKKSVKLDDGYYSKAVMRYVAPGGQFTIEKVYAIDKATPYGVDLTINVKNNGQAVLTDKLQLSAFGYKNPKKEKSFLDFRPSELEGICHVGEKTKRTVFDSIKETETHKGKVHWAGISLRYFNYVALYKKTPEQCDISKVDNDYVKVTTQFEKFALAQGELYSIKQLLFMGPKDIDVMEKIRPDLSETVDYGILTPLAKPLRWGLNFFYNLVHNWGFAIILLTLVIKLATWPITEKSYANAERMKEIQPQLDELRTKHENDQQRLAEETMKLFKENKFNPLGGCLPMVLQMPILYGLYVMIVYSVELYQAEFLFHYTDLSSPDPYFILPILMGLVMIVQQRFMSVATPNAQTKIMMQLMPIMFTAFMLFLPSGLVLYYFLNLVLGVLQQWLIRRKFERRRQAKANA